MDELAHIDATSARARFRTRELSPLDVLDAQIARAERMEPRVRAFADTFFDRARAQARAAGDAYARAARTGDPLPRLLGLTVAAKEKHALAGEPLTEGLPWRQAERAPADHPVIERIRAAGGIVHARTTTPQLSCATVTHSPMWGITRNPWNLEATPGGSSGGAAAALASGTTTLATASDIAGSTRVPAGFCGLVGYKAPYGRIPGAPPLSADWYRGDGPMARTVADVALLGAVMAGRHPADPASWGPSTGAIATSSAAGAAADADTVAASAHSVAGLRVGVSTTLGDYPVHPMIAAATMGAARALARSGADIVELDLPWTTAQLTETAFAHFGQLLGPWMEEATAGHEAELAEYTHAFIARAREARQRYSLLDSVRMDAVVHRQLAGALGGVDVLLCPTSAVTSLTADGSYRHGIDIDGIHYGHYWVSHLTVPFNVTNRHPVMSVPVGIAPNGVPIGVQVVAHPFDEQMCFTVSQALQDSLGLRLPWPEG